jgi:SET domain-containing protein
VWQGEAMTGKKRAKTNGHGGRLNGHSIWKANGDGPAYAVRRSKIHGRGVFATRPIPKGARIVEYRGKRIPYTLASDLYPDEEGVPTHTFLFELDDDMVIDAAQGGNAARWINHSCAPNCEAVDDGGRIYIEAIRTIRPGEELGYDYNITLEERHTPAEKKRWSCLCGAKACRRTLLAKKR